MKTETARKLKTLRKASGLSQFRLASIADVTPDYISKIELGKCQNVGLKTLEKILQALGSNLEDFFGSKAA